MIVCNTRTIWQWMLSMVLLCLATLTKTEAQPQARFERVTVAPFVIEAVPLEGTPSRTDEAEVLQRLRELAVATAEKSAVKKGLANMVVRSDANSGSVPSVMRITGTIRMPVSLPRDVRGERAAMRRGPFATAIVVVTDTQGQSVAREEVVLNWNDVRWSQRMGQGHRVNRPVDDVLKDFVREAVNRAFEALARQR